MNIANALSALSLAFAMFGGVALIAPTSAHAGESKQNSKFISYGALRRDNVPCSVRGPSFNNCRPGAQANPYTRGCSKLTRCRG